MLKRAAPRAVAPVRSSAPRIRASVPRHRMDVDHLRSLSKEQLIEMIMKERASTVLHPPTAAAAQPKDTTKDISLEPEKKSAKKKRGREAFDWSKHELGQVALKIAYCGWDYYGYASQPYGDSVN